MVRVLQSQEGTDSLSGGEWPEEKMGMHGGGPKWWHSGWRRVEGIIHFISVHMIVAHQWRIC